jgi:hypothetical protein
MPHGIPARRMLHVEFCTLQSACCMLHVLWPHGVRCHVACCTFVLVSGTGSAHDVSSATALESAKRDSAQAGLGASGIRRKRDSAQAGFGASGIRRKRESAQAGVGASGIGRRKRDSAQAGSAQAGSAKWDRPKRDRPSGIGLVGSAHHASSAAARCAGVVARAIGGGWRASARALRT